MGTGTVNSTPNKDEVSLESLDLFPLSFSQQRLWFLHQIDPNGATYNMPAAVRILGPLRIDVLESSLASIVERHEALRTRFVTREDTPYQVVDDHVALTLAVETMEGGPAAHGEPSADSGTPRDTLGLALEIAQTEVRRPFDLETGPLFRFRLLRIREGDHIFIVTIHHIAADGWSIDLFNAELSELYSSMCAGRRPDLLPLPIQYVDYALWQRDNVDGPEWQRQLDYWRNRLQGLSELQLATDRPRPAGPSHRGSHRTREMPGGLAEKLEDIGRRQQASLFMVLLAGFKVLLCRYTGQEDIVVGSPIAGRTRAELEPLIGFFVNSLVLRTQVDYNDTFLDVLKKVRETTLGAYGAQDISFDKLVEELSPNRTPGKNPLFQHSFALQHVAMPLLQSSLCDNGGLTFEPLAVDPGTARFDLEFNMRRSSDGLTLSVFYATDLFDADTIDDMMGCYRTALSSIAENPDWRVSRVTMLEPNAADRLISLGRGSAHPGSTDLITLFERRAQASPESVALWFDGVETTYGSLNRNANRLAHFLRSLGVGPDVLVGICLERSPEMIVAMLAIVKAGGAYTPLQPGDPGDRLNGLIRDAGIHVVVTRQPWGEPFGPQVHLVCLDSDREEIATYPTTTPLTAIHPDNLAYVVYTSGSTGIPKGVAIAHGGIAKLVTETGYVDFRPDDSFLQLAPLSFDASAFEIWGALLTGARLVIPPPGVLTLQELGALIQSQRVSVSLITASLFHQLIDEAPDCLGSLRYLFAGGEVVSAPHVRKALTSLQQTQLLDSYGPTEVTVYACWHRILRSFGEDVKTVPIGRPIPNRSVTVVDSALNLVPKGVIGELCVSGVGLARGYVNAPRLTAERFVPDPFTAEPGNRIYRTGDLVRYRTDGEIEFIGRRDNQVKVRGFRIELGEVEAVLRLHPQVEDVVAIVREDKPDVKQIVAYIVGSGTPSPSWRDFAESRLPEYMRPAAYVVLDTLPLKPNGKIDRAVLPVPTSSGDVTNYVAPRSALETLLVGIWQDVLSVDQIGIHDNFFDLGGDSMLALRAVNRLNRHDISVTIKELYRHQTVADLAQAIEGSEHEE